MSAITIPKSLAGKDDLVLMPRKEYERLIAAASPATLTRSQKRSLEHMRKDKAAGKLLSYDEFKAAVDALDQ